MPLTQPWWKFWLDPENLYVFDAVSPHGLNIYYFLVLEPEFVSGQVVESSITAYSQIVPQVVGKHNRSQPSYEQNNLRKRSVASRT
jgi:hypothetical protein